MATLPDWFSNLRPEDLEELLGVGTLKGGPMPMQAPPLGGPAQKPPGDPLASLAPQELEAMLGLGGLGNESGLLEQQLAQALAMRQPGRQHTSPLGAALGGIGDIINTGTSLLKEKDIRGQQQQLAGRRMEGERAQVKFQDLMRKQQAQRELDQEQRGFGHQELMQSNQQKFAGSESGLDRKGQMERLMLELGMRERLAGDKAKLDKTEATTKAAMDLRKELQGRPEFKAYQEVSAAFDKVQRAAKSNTPAADMSLIFSYMKLLDPGSSVREGEYANAQNTTGVPGQVLNMYNKALSGNFLNPEQRGHFVTEAKNAYGAHQSQFKALADQYSGLASKSGVDPGDVVLSGTPAAAASSAPTGPGGPDVIQGKDGKRYRRQSDGTYEAE